MAKKIVIVDVEETLEDKVSRYRRRFHIMTFVSLFLVLGIIIRETDSTKKLTLEMNKNINNSEELLDDDIDELDSNITSNDLNLILNSNIISGSNSNIVTNSNSNAVSNAVSNNTAVTNNVTSNNNMTDLVSKVK